MTDTIQPGLETRQQFDVDDARVTRHMGEELGVYGTPFLLRDVEQVCHNLLQEQLDDDQSTVGTHVNLQHLAPTLEGARVTITAKVSAVDRRAVTFEVVVRDDMEELARIEHGRFVVDKSKLKARLQDKAKKLRGE